ncbi:NADH-quinone oxidoreductase subunit L [Chloroflexi bacterium TSY]|nr:NADH-quinone oxidoreductase subunit L [Chloroflexi bacterium TSY]
MFLSVAWLLFVFPALGALINLFAGAYIGRKVIGSIAALAVALSFVLGIGLYAGLLTLAPEEQSITVHMWDWITVGSFHASAAMLIDPLSVTMTLIVTGVGLLIHIYAIGYMEHDEYFQRFFVYLNFFIFAMLILVLSDNFVGMFVGWEGVGLASFLLIGFYFDRTDETYGSYADCGKKAFIVNRIGDFGMILAIAAIWTTVGTVTFGDVFAQFDTRHHDGDHGIVGAANLICLLLLLGATGKSAQLPLYVWLPDAMAGPTPVSALIHAATMVTAGIYMIARTHTIWYIAVDASTIAAWIGGITALLAASIALVQTDLKKILAYSTISQLGFMMMAVGVGAYGAAIFHLTTHAFFKALLFLAAGSVMHGLHDVLDIRRMGGLSRKMPQTARTFTIGAVALAGLPPLAGFFSKDAIKVGVMAEDPILYVVALFAALLTAFYSFRTLLLVFYGEPRDQELHNSAHESPLIMTAPLWILAVLSIFGGVLNLPGLLTMEHWLEPSLGFHEPSLALELLTALLSILVASFGAMLAVSYYRLDERRIRALISSLSFFQPMLERKWYVEDFYRMAIVAPLEKEAAWLANVFDRKGIDFVVNWFGQTGLRFGEWARRLQNGMVPTYAFSILLGVVVTVAYFLLV